MNGSQESEVATLPPESKSVPGDSREPRSPRSHLLPLVTSRKRLLLDRAARTFVAAGGFAIIASILAILFFILLEVLPLLREARVRQESVPVRGQQPYEAVLVDEHQSHAALLDASGNLRVVALPTGNTVLESGWQEWLAEAATSAAPSSDRRPEGEVVAVQVPPESSTFAAATSDGWVLLRPLAWNVTFEDDTTRRIVPVLKAPLAFELDPRGGTLSAFAADAQRDDQFAVAAQLADGSIELVRLEVLENAFSGEIERQETRWSLGSAPPLTAMVVEIEQGNLFGGTANGEIYWWHLPLGSDPELQVVSAGISPVTALTFLVGRRSLVVGQADGAVSVWFPVTGPATAGGQDSHTVLTRIRVLPSFGAAVATFAPSIRNRTFLAIDDRAQASLYFSTSDRLLWRGPLPVRAATAAVLAPKGDGAVIAGRDGLVRLRIDNPHPEVSWKALFGKVWFEGYSKPEYVWQSTGGTDDFESKLSLTPLVVGTLKGTFYSLLFAIPLGVLGAMFASQFLHPRWLGIVKPVVEIMASLPSVVLGFLAGLWLAPLLQRNFPGLIVAMVVLPIAFWITGLAWERLPLTFRQRFPAGTELIPYLGVSVLTIAASLALSGTIENALFDGSFSQWLLTATGLTYDQRNAVVVGLAMGFAVIPIIFAIAEDAFSNVPKSLIAGSLALGANRWQTVARIVLPTASPGIFSAVMVGFGRAVGETMIVLMATGNTPIMDFSPFNGFRTLSANIAVEIPEAPHGSTLYRTLFLAALLLFILTFLVNTAAEIVRQRLRRRFAEL